MIVCMCVCVYVCICVYVSVCLSVRVRSGDVFGTVRVNLVNGRYRGVTSIRQVRADRR